MSVTIGHNPFFYYLTIYQSAVENDVNITGETKLGPSLECRL